MEHQFIEIIWTLVVTLLEDNLKVYAQNNMNKKITKQSIFTNYVKIGGNLMNIFIELAFKDYRFYMYLLKIKFKFKNFTQKMLYTFLIYVKTYVQKIGRKNNLIH